MKKRFVLIRLITDFALLFILASCGQPQSGAAPQPIGNLAPAQQLEDTYIWTVGLDPGHGWQGDPGATGNGLQEKTVNLDIALQTKTILESNGFRVIMTRTGDDSNDLTQAAKIINAQNPNPDLVVSIHANSGGSGSTATGTEACYTVGKSADTESKRLATLLTNSISSKLSLVNRGIFPENSDSRCARRANTGWNQLYIHNMNPPTALIETAFLSNPFDADLLKNRGADFASAIADAIIAYLKNVEAPTASPPITLTSTSVSQPPVVSIGTSNVLVIDTSGSMDDALSAGGVKLDAAKDAGRKLLDIIGAENEAGVSANHEVAIVDFSDTAIVDIGFTADIDSAQNALSSLYTTGGTGMPKGLKAALDLFPATLTGKSFIILLSDGQPNIGLNDESDKVVVRQQVLDLAGEAGQRGICVYTIGFGDAALGSIDDDFLTQVASASGCGTYHNAQNAWELANIYINLRHESTGSTLLTKTGDIKQGENLEIGNAQVPDNQAMMLFTLNWPGSQLDAVLTDPNGKLVDMNYPGASLLTKNNLVSIIIQNPLAGSWNVAAFGAQVPEQVINYNAILSVRPNPNPPTPVPVTPTPAVVQPSGGSPFAILIIVLAGAGMMVYVITLTGRRARTQRPPLYSSSSAVLVGLNGTYAGYSIPVRDGFLIGSSFACALRLSDSSVSWQHARLRFVNGQWYIQDMNSKSGLYVNGKRVQAVPLNKGNRIRVGSIEFEFR
jgi:N-acetylmuramoyl-L-alanine amidase/Mg-chelatase subunit ChlD